MDLTIPVAVILFVGASVVLVMLYSRSQQQVKTSILGIYSQDLTRLAREGKLDPVVGRQHEIHRVIQILSRRTKNNPVLIGDSGVGKTAVVEELANEISRGDVPDSIKGKRVLALDLSGLVAGTKYRGEFEKRLKTVMDEIIASKRQIILFIDELQTLAQAGEATGAIDAADILKPALARGELQAIGATTMEEYEKYIAKDVTLERRFQPIIVKEPSAAETIEILKGLRPRYEGHHQVKILDEAIQEAVTLSDHFLVDRYFPDKAIDLIDEAAAKVRLERIMDPNKSQDVPQVTGNDVRAIIKEWTQDLVSFHHPKPWPSAVTARAAPVE
jgi:ATP-dependent Clp protease ATP-binding subunit ClpC